MGSTCAYCELPEIRMRTIAENEFAWAFPTNIPVVAGHVLISPKRCVPTLKAMTADEREAVLALADSIMDALRISHAAEGFNCAWNQGTLAGQSVPHFHLHVLPRKEGDAGIGGYDPRSMLYRTGDREPTSEDELLRVRDTIRNAFPR